MLKPTKRTIIIICAIAIISVMVLYFLEKNRTTNIVKDPFYTEASDTTKVDNEKKEAFIENTPSASSPDPVTSDQISLTAQVSGDNVNILTKLANLPGGVCKLTISNGATTVSKQADVIYQPQFSSCAGFTVPIAEVGTGTWDVKLRVAYNATSLEKTIVIEVKP